MRRVVLLGAARRDLTDILEYVTRESGTLVIGRRFVAEIRGKIAKLASLPGTLGRARPELRPDIRSLAFKGYVIFFRYIDDNTLEIVNILEGHRDIDAHFERDGLE